MLLTRVDKVRTDLGYEDMPDINVAIRSAIDMAEIELASALETTFLKASYKDIFYVEESRFQRPGHGTTYFKLSNGLVRAVPEFIVELANDPDDFGVEPVATITNTKLRAEKGVVADFSNIYDRFANLTPALNFKASRQLAGGYLQVTYDAGFNLDSDDATSYDLSEVPLWLQEVAKALAMVKMLGHPLTEDIANSQDPKTLQLAAQQMLSPHLRYEPNSLLPL